MKKKQPLPSLMLATIGVVFGDIGTSPLYTLKECFSRYYGFQTEPHVIFGFLSLIFWMLIVIVSIKYIIFVMRADNKGEGGIIALMSLTSRRLKPRYAALVLFLGLVGTSFFYGEVVITPAMTVLSAVEGLEIAAPHLTDYVIPITIAVLAVLFLIQRKGSGGISKLFSPIMLLWFIVIAVLGICSVVQTPQVLAALNPYWAAQFLIHYKMSAFFALGATVLAITGTEALYADMGHFGRTSIRLSWLMVVLPALVLNYFGQGALLLRDPAAIVNPFYLLVPSWAIIPLLVLATFAAIIASQAVISGVFSLTRQAMNLGYIAPMRVKHTSEHESGQIYLPFINWLLFVAVIIVVLGFKHSSHLAAAYGIAVTGTMVISSILISITAFKRWRWPLFVVVPMMILLLCIDIPIFSANTVKIINGGWLPLAIGCVMFIIMTTWKKERTNLFKRLHERGNSLEAMIAALEKNPPLRVQGTAIYLSRNLHTIPVAFIHNLKHNKVMHERIIILSLKRKDEPYVHNIQRLKIEQISTDFWRVQADFGYLESPNMEQLFYRCTLEGLPCQLQDCSFFMSDQTLILEKRPWYSAWRSKLFVMMYRNALRAAGQFDIPPDRVIELGSQVEI